MSALADAFREARWLGAGRALAWVRVLAAVGALTLLALVADTRGGTVADGWGRPLATDFSGFWTAGRVALSGAPEAAWDPGVHAGLQRRLFPARLGYAAGDCPFFYPPPFLMLCMALALLPYGLAAALWLLLTGAGYLAAMRALLPPRWPASLVALAFPAVLLNAEYGQNGTLWAALLGTAALQLERRPRIAGACLGLLCVKPPLALLVGPALLAAGRFRALAWAAGTAGVVCLCAWLVLGGASWRAFLASAAFARRVLEGGLAGHGRMASSFAATRLLGGGVGVSWAVQVAVSGVALAAVVGVAWRRPGARAEVATLAAGACLASPYLFDYDLTVMAVPLAWAGALAVRDGFRPWERLVLAAAFALPLVARPLAMEFDVPVAPPVLAALLAVVVRRASGLPAFPWWRGVGTAGLRRRLACWRAAVARWRPGGRPVPALPRPPAALT